MAAGLSGGAGLQRGESGDFKHAGAACVWSARGADGDLVRGGNPNGDRQRARYSSGAFTDFALMAQILLEVTKQWRAVHPGE